VRIAAHFAQRGKHHGGHRTEHSTENNLADKK
jgi:hypothetical protein